MNSFDIFLLIYSLGTSICSGSELQVIEGNGVLASGMYDILSKDEGNVIFSPISTHAVLSMAYQGANGDTAKAFASTLKTPRAQDAAEGYKTLMDRLNNVENVTLSIANKVYVMENQKLLDSYKSSVSNNFYTDVESLNFAATVESAKTINQWVENKTNEKIKDLIKADDLNGLTRLVLVNAIYFKGAWLYPFDKEFTKKYQFYLNNNDSVDVDMMLMKEHLQYKEDTSLNAKIVALPYTNRNLSMIIILPNERNGIHDLEKKLSTIDLTKIIDRLEETQIRLLLPKFKVEQSIDLRNVLEQVGLGIIFDKDKADFSKMIEDQQLFVSKAIQKSFVEINEEGSEAAGATSLILMTRSGGGRELITLFQVDHPFVFIIMDNRNILFIGRMYKP